MLVWELHLLLVILHKAVLKIDDQRSCEYCNKSELKKRDRFGANTKNPHFACLAGDPQRSGRSNGSVRDHIKPTTRAQALKLKTCGSHE
jgi:hypothetical protein